MRGLTHINAAKAPPQFAELVAAAAARRAAGDKTSPAFRLAVHLPMPVEFERDSALRDAAPLRGYGEIGDIAEDLSPPEMLDRATALAAASRALRRLADSFGATARDIARDTAITPPARTPARNVAQSQSAIGTTRVLHDEAQGLVTVDIHAARVSENLWEIAVFDQSTAAAGGFPYAAAPLLVMHAAIDVRQAEFATAGLLAGALSLRREQAVAAIARRPGAWPALAMIAVLLAAMLFLAASPLAGLAFAVAALAALGWLDRLSRDVAER